MRELASKLTDERRRIPIPGGMQLLSRPPFLHPDGQKPKTVGSPPLLPRAGVIIQHPSFQVKCLFKSVVPRWMSFALVMGQHSADLNRQTGILGEIHASSTGFMHSSGKLRDVIGSRSAASARRDRARPKLRRDPLLPKVDLGVLSVASKGSRLEPTNRPMEMPPACCPCSVTTVAPGDQTASGEGPVHKADYTTAKNLSVKARNRIVWLLVVLPLIVVSCGTGPASQSSVRPTKHSWPSRTMASTCATVVPSRWMGCMVKADPAFSNIPLSYLAIPGADNAGTFNLDPTAFDTQMESGCSTFSPATASALSRPATSSALFRTAQKAERFSATQDESITSQLNEGARWIDLKVAYNGNGNPVTGWRVAQNLYSDWPLSEYLDEVANWAAAHPTEVIVVDLSKICYDPTATVAIDQGLWANFATKSTEGAGPLTLADVAVNPTSLNGSLANATLREFGRARRNVAVLVPSTAKKVRILQTEDHVAAALTAPSGRIPIDITEVEDSDPRFAPTSPAAFSNATQGLATFPISANPSLGALQGHGLYVSKLAYELKGSSTQVQSQVMSSFVGLVIELGHFPAWVSGLQGGAYQRILSRWGSATNVVLADGVELGGFTQAVIELNGR